MMLFRLASSPRELVAGLLASIGDLLGISDAGHAIGLFDGLTEAQVVAARTWLTADPAYRGALAALDSDDGQRTL
jgi:energy-converting hydrogenase Eha subunit B